MDKDKQKEIDKNLINLLRSVEVNDHIGKYVAAMFRMMKRKDDLLREIKELLPTLIEYGDEGFLIDEELSEKIKSFQDKIERELL